MGAVGCWCIRVCARSGRGPGRSPADDRGGRVRRLRLDELRWLLADCANSSRRMCCSASWRSATATICRWPAGITAPAISSGCKRCGGRRCRSRCCIRSRRIGRSSKPAAGWLARWRNSAKLDMANEVVATLVELDPSDPLRVAAMVDECDGRRADRWIYRAIDGRRDGTSYIGESRGDSTHPTSASGEHAAG